MSSLAQDELGHAAALYGLLGGLTGDGPRRPRLRPRAGRVPPLPAARPRPRRLGDDDRPALPVRHRRRGPARGAGRRRRGRRWPSSSASCVREERYHRMHVDTWLDAAGPRPAAKPRDRLLRGARRRWPRTRPRSSRHSPGSRHWSRPGSWPRRCAELEARWRAAIVPTLRGLDLPSPPRPGDPARRPERPRRAVPTGCGASSRWSAEPIPGRPGERGRDAGRGRADAGRRGRRVPARRPAVAADAATVLRGASPRSWTRSCRCSPSSTSGSISDVDGRRGDGSIRVELLPTFVGCPALELIRRAVADRLAGVGRTRRRRSRSSRPSPSPGRATGSRPPDATGPGRRPASRHHPSPPTSAARTAATAGSSWTARSARRSAAPLLLPRLPPAVRSDQARLIGRVGRRRRVGHRSASSVPGRWAPGSRRSPSRRAARSSCTTSTPAAARARDATRIRTAWRRRAAQPRSRPGLDRRVGRGPARPAATRARPSTGSSTTPTSSSSAALEDLELKRAIFRTLDGVPTPDVDPGHQHERAVRRRDRRGDRPAGAASSACTSSTPRRSWRSSRSSRRRLADPAVVARAVALVTAWGKTPVRAADRPGFIVNRVNRPFTIEALRMLEAGAAAVGAVDGAIRAAASRWARSS